MYLGEIDFDPLVEPASRVKTFEGIPRYPAVKRDIAVVVPDEVRESKVREVIMRQDRSLIKSVRLFDVYRGEQIPKGTKSLAYGMVFRSDSKTLTEDEVDRLQKRIEQSLADRFAASIRTKS